MGKKKNRFFPILIILATFALLTIALLGQNTWRLDTKTKRTLALMDENELQKTKDAPADSGKGTECLYLWDSSDTNSSLLYEQMQQILHDMRVSYTEVDIDNKEIPDCSEYRTVVLGTSDYTRFRDEIEKMTEWVMDGGCMMIAQVPEIEPVTNWLFQKAGVRSIGATLYEMPGLRMVDETLIHGTQEDYLLEEPFESSLAVSLDEKCKVHVVSSDDSEIPLLWERPVDDGKIVVVNLGIYDKAYRGVYSSAYSLLDEVCAWPVINGATWYLDDFPSPVPSGVSTYIERDYNMDIATFYSQVWWKNISDLAKEYDIRYTGMVIEEYSDQVKGPFASNGGTSRFQYLGNMLLQEGGEIGLHGYNHMPLVLDNFDYGDEFDSYKPWESLDDMKQGLDELNSFCSSLYPNEQFQVYVPPSNVLSEEGRSLLLEQYEDIKAIASVYLGSGVAYEQEFEVAEDGMVETPRIISGYLLGDYEELAAMSELNLHFVNTHFQHPDDVMDEDRGANLGWEKLFSRLNEYTEWLYGAAPDLRNLTGSELAGAVQRFYYLDVQREVTDEELKLDFGNFQDEAWMMVRFNDWEPQETEGGELTKIQGNLYLLKVTKDHVTIKKKVA